LAYPISSTAKDAVGIRKTLAGAPLLAALAAAGVPAALKPAFRAVGPPGSESRIKLVLADPTIAAVAKSLPTNASSAAIEKAVEAATAPATSKGPRLHGGAVAGIIIGCIGGAVLLGLLAGFVCLRQDKIQERRRTMEAEVRGLAPVLALRAPLDCR
jgi:hypothetical protein